MVNTNLVSIKINNIPLQVPAGTRILDACRDNGTDIAADEFTRCDEYANIATDKDEIGRAHV